MTSPPRTEELPAAESFFPQRRYNLAAPLCFVHVQKAAGTSVRLVLENAFEGNRTYPNASPIFSGRYIPLRRTFEAGDDLRRYDMLSGHFGAVVAEHLGPDANLFTWLREPGDRVISEFFFFAVQERRNIDRRYGERLDAGERTETVFLDWLADVPPGFHRQMAQLVCGNERNYQRWQDEHPETSITDAAFAALRRCFFIGLMEDQERSLDALCAITSILPPSRNQRRNIGMRRPGTLALTADEQATFDTLLAPDRAFYALARDIHHRQMADLARRGGLEPALALIGNREALRKHILEAAATRAPELTTWQAWDPVLGENLDGREQLETSEAVRRRWRWTAPQADSYIHFRLPRTAFDLRIQLNPATPPEHVPGVALRLCGEPVALVKQEAEGDCINLVAHVQSWRAACRSWPNFIFTRPRCLTRAGSCHTQAPACWASPSKRSAQGAWDRSSGWSDGHRWARVSYDVSAAVFGRNKLCDELYRGADQVHQRRRSRWTRDAS